MPLIVVFQSKKIAFELESIPQRETFFKNISRASGKHNGIERFIAQLIFYNGVRTEERGASDAL